ncbi:MAG: hypothetical protein ACLR43_11090 [Faecalibacillus faecis]
MKTDIQTKLKTLFDEKIKNRKAMFIPIAGVAAFMLVGYAGVIMKSLRLYQVIFKFLTVKSLIRMQLMLLIIMIVEVSC